MSEQREIVCRCEEVTREEIMEAIRQGDGSLDAIKRRTRAGMGFCQGRTCRRLIARILSAYVVLGVILTGVGLWGPLVEWAGCGATVPLLGFGYTMAEGVKKAVAESGLLGAFTGGLTATAGGIAAAVGFSLLAAFLFKPGDRS